MPQSLSVPKRASSAQRWLVAMVAASLLATLLGAASVGAVRAGAPDQRDQLRFMWAMAGQESGWDYYARNSASGAFGKYQIMPFNWPVWAELYVGDRRADQTPFNQEKVAYGKLRDLYRWLGSWKRVAYWWLTGRTDRDTRSAGRAMPRATSTTSCACASERPRADRPCRRGPHRARARVTGDARATISCSDSRSRVGAGPREGASMTAKCSRSMGPRRRVAVSAGSGWSASMAASAGSGNLPRCRPASHRQRGAGAMCRTGEARRSDVTGNMPGHVRANGTSAT